MKICAIVAAMAIPVLILLVEIAVMERGYQDSVPKAAVFGALMLLACLGSLMGAETYIVQPFGMAEVGEYPLVWVGVPHDDERRSVAPVVSAGRANSVTKDARISWSEDAWGRGTPGTAIRSRTTYICNNVAQSPGFEPWRDSLMSNGILSTIGVPLFVRGAIFGSGGFRIGQA